MSVRRRLPSRARGCGAIAALGTVYVALATGWAIEHLMAGDPISNVALVSCFIGVPGLVLLYGSYRLPRIDIRPDCYPTITNWCLGGLGLLLGILLLYQLEPAESVSEPVRAAFVLTAFGSVAGFGVGVHDALAETRAREVDRRNRDLQRTKRRLDETVARLEEANAELEASNERLEQFAYVASHDLQEPLRMVTSYLTLIEKRYADALDEDGEEFIAYAVDGAERMREMIDALLEYSRVSTQGNPFETVELDAVLADVREDLQIQIDEREATVAAESLPRVEGDPRQLRQLFQNLVSNGIEYSGDESPRVRVSADRNGTGWEVSVRDNGIGIDPDDQDRIFEVFQRLHSREEYSGTGIGLALCQRIVERHGVRSSEASSSSAGSRSESAGGEIRIDSEPGEGSTFTVTLPAVDGDE